MTKHLESLFRKSFLAMPGDLSDLAYLESESYLAGRGFVPGLTSMVTIYTLACC